MKTSKQVLIILITIAVTIFAVLVILNLGLGEKKIEKRIETLYTVEDPQFLRTMGVMLGPPVIPGNAGLTLLNGDQIFPAMLKAIKEARKTISFESAMDEATGASTVKVAGIDRARTQFRVEYNPSHPAADAKGYVKLPNVDVMMEVTDMREANRSYEANLQVIKQAREMISMTIDLLRSNS